MRRWIHTNRRVTGDYAALEYTLRAHIRQLLHTATGTHWPSEPAGDGSFGLQIGSEVAGFTPTKAIRVQTGVATLAERRSKIPLSWHADPVRGAFPEFAGAVELTPLNADMGELTITGSYDLPLGFIGAIGEAALLRNLAQRTIDTLADALARALTEAAAPGAPVDAEIDEGPARPMHVRDVMTPRPIVLDERMPLRTAALILVHQELSGAPVVDAEGALLGVLSEADLLHKEAWPQYGLGHRAREAERRASAVSVGEACSRPAFITSPDSTLRDAATVMRDHDLARLVVVDESRVAGIVARRDVIRALLRTDAELQVAAEAVLDGMHEDNVQAEVVWGVVYATGKVHLRSRLGALITGLRALDGILDVEADDVGYEVDDVTPVTIPL